MTQYTKEQEQAILDMAKAILTKDIAPPVVCENCGEELPTHADAMNVAHVIQIGVPGHAAIPAFQCPLTEHWACSIDCWSAIAHKCIDEHMTPLLHNAHETIGRQTPVPRKRLSERHTGPSSEFPGKNS